MYKIVGGDQREYGPATSDQVREWIKTGRANAQTLATFEGSPWKPLSTFPEFADALRVAAPPPLSQAPGVPGQPGQAYMGAQTNNLAIAGLVMSILYCCFPLPLLGLVLSVMAYNQINKNPQAYTTPKIVPILGIIFGAIFVILFVIGIATGAMSEALRGFQR
jgi:hypothetical protein